MDEQQTNWNSVAGHLQQRIAQMTADYEGRIAVLQAQLQDAQQRLAEYEKPPAEAQNEPVEQ